VLSGGAAIGGVIFGAIDGLRAQRTFGGMLLRLLVVVALMLGLMAAGPAPAHAVSEERVREVQQNLRRLGIHITVDGVEGPRTRQAVCAARRLLRYKRVSRSRITWEDVTAIRKATTWKKPRHGNTYLWVDRRCQMLYQAKGGEFIRVLKASTGKPGHRTPGGTYWITWRWPGWHDSSEYPSDSGNGNMYNSMYFKSGGYAIHGSRSVPYYPASHGCVRVTVWAADRLWNSVPVGTKVIIFGYW
jgi:hypothetical protein